MNTDFSHFSLLEEERRIQIKLRLPHHLYSETTYLAKRTLLIYNIDAFQMCNLLKFTRNNLVLTSYMLSYL